jgi:prepilin-type N-terminal cleavage/methylation domain-containing protein
MITRLRTASAAGFNLVELLVVMALIAILSLIGLPWLMGTIYRSKLVGAARETGVLMQLARLESIKRSAPAMVVWDATTDSFLAFLDVDGDRAYVDGTDRLITAGYRLPNAIELWGPGDGSAEGTNAIADWDELADCANPVGGPIFRNDGSAACAGAFRFRDPRGNFIETRVLFPATGKIVIRKWFGGDVDTDWSENHADGRDWTW